MTDREFKYHRIGFLEGAIQGITLYAIWKDGVHKVGYLEKPLAEVIAPYREELYRIHEMLNRETNCGDYRKPLPEDLFWSAP